MKRFGTILIPLLFLILILAVVMVVAVPAGGVSMPSSQEVAMATPLSESGSMPVLTKLNAVAQSTPAVLWTAGLFFLTITTVVAFRKRFTFKRLQETLSSLTWKARVEFHRLCILSTPA